jgi:hypothetical protein
MLTPSTIDSEDLISLVFHKLIYLPSTLVMVFFYQEYPQVHMEIHTCMYIAAGHTLLLTVIVFYSSIHR